MSLFKVVLPPLTQLMGKFGEWADAQRKLNGSGAFAQWVKSLDVNEIWESLVGLLGSLKEAFAWANWAAKAFGGWGKVLLALAALIGINFLSSVGGLIVSLGKLGLAFTTNPLFLKGSSLLFSLAKASFFAGSGLASVGKALMALGGAGPWILVAALTTAVYAIYKNWDGVVSYFQNLWQGVQDAFAAGWTNGIVQALWNFNPLRLILKGMNELVAYFTGFNLFETVGKKWREQLVSWMPSRLLAWFGLDTAANADAGASSSGQEAAAPLNMAPAARELAAARSEHLERQENTVTLVPPEGWGLQSSGPSSGVSYNGGSMQIGLENWGG
jgi:hypothetical protein